MYPDLAPGLLDALAFVGLFGLVCLRESSLMWLLSSNSLPCSPSPRSDKSKGHGVQCDRDAPFWDLAPQG